MAKKKPIRRLSTAQLRAQMLEAIENMSLRIASERTARDSVTRVIAQDAGDQKEAIDKLQPQVQQLADKQHRDQIAHESIVDQRHESQGATETAIIRRLVSVEAALRDGVHDPKGAQAFAEEIRSRMTRTERDQQVTNGRLRELMERLPDQPKSLLPTGPSLENQYLKQQETIDRVVNLGAQLEVDVKVVHSRIDVYEKEINALTKSVRSLERKTEKHDDDMLQLLKITHAIEKTAEEMGEAIRTFNDVDLARFDDRHQSLKRQVEELAGPYPTMGGIGRLDAVVSTMAGEIRILQELLGVSGGVPGNGMPKRVSGVLADMHAWIIELRGHFNITAGPKLMPRLQPRTVAAFQERRGYCHNELIAIATDGTAWRYVDAIVMGPSRTLEPCEPRWERWEKLPELPQT